ncbi:MAG: hypothetical protein NTZ80_00825 [Patescibacteria group bacterium]|nr:hypothetical protein [Patescibacteria group bacterium]
MNKEQGFSLEHYLGFKYNDEQRFISYFYQLQSVIGLHPQSVLEIGVGSSLVASYLRKLKIKVDTLDHNASLNPDIVSSVSSMRLA